jgi:hypothetical protein
VNDGRAPRSRDELAQLVDYSLYEEALAEWQAEQGTR